MPTWNHPNVQNGSRDIDMTLYLHLPQQLPYVLLSQVATVLWCKHTVNLQALQDVSWHVDNVRKFRREEQNVPELRRASRASWSDLRNQQWPAGVRTSWLSAGQRTKLRAAQSSEQLGVASNHFTFVPNIDRLSTFPRRPEVCQHVDSSSVAQAALHCICRRRSNDLIFLLSKKLMAR